MTNKSLEYFLVVVKHLNISRAARELYISQPALSKQLGQLEAELGVTLFDRGKHSLKLTRAGEVLLAETNELFRKQETMLERVRAAGNLSENTLHICHMPGSLNYKISDNLADFQEAYPQISLRLTGSSPSKIFSDLLNNQIDAGIILSATTNCPEPLKMDTIHEAQLYLAVPERHPYASKKEISFHDISDQTLLYLSEHEAPAQHALLPYFLHGNNRQHNNQIQYLPNMETVVSLVRANIGISFIARDYCVASLKNIAMIPISDAAPINLCLVYHPKQISEQMKKFKSFLLP